MKATRGPLFGLSSPVSNIGLGGVINALDESPKPPKVVEKDVETEWN